MTETSLLTKITIIIIVGMLVWEFGVPYIDDTIKTPSQYITDLIMPDNSDITWQFYITNLITGNKTVYNLVGVQIGAVYQLEQYCVYETGIILNGVKGSLFDSYNLNMVIEIVSGNGTGTITPILIKIPGYKFYNSNYYIIPTDLYFVNYERSDSLKIVLTDSSGDYIPVYSNNNPSFQLGVDKA